MDSTDNTPRRSPSRQALIQRIRKISLLVLSILMTVIVLLPIGWMVTAIGAMLVGYGVISDQAIYAKSLGINVNLWWGVVLLLFGGMMLWLARRRGRAPS